MGEFFAFFSALFFSCQSLLIRRGLMEEETGNAREVQFWVLVMCTFTSLLGVFTSFLVGSNIFEQFSNLTITSIFFLVAEGFLGPMAGLYLITLAIGQIGASRTSALRASTPFFVTILSVFFLQETPGITGAIGLCVLMAGVILVSIKVEQESVSLIQKTKIKGGVIALAGSFLFALSQITRGLVLKEGATPLTATIVGGLAATIISLISCRIKAGNFNFIKQMRPKSFYYYLGAGLSTTLGRYALFFAFNLMPVWIATAIRNTQPLIVILLSYIFLKKIEPINLRLITGTLLIIAGVWILMF